MFYSNTIFANVGGISSNSVTLIIGVVNFISTCIGLIGIFKYGRKTLMVNFNFAIAIVLVLTGVFGLT